MTDPNPSGTPRRPISKRLRYEVLRRDNHACRYCGVTAPDAKLTVDHVQPVALGGSDEPKNLVTACADCNSGKTSTSPNEPIVENVADDALRWAEAMKEAARLQANDKRKTARQLAKVNKKWEGWINTYNDEPFSRDSDWKASVRTFLTAGLTPDDLCNLIDETMEKQNVKNCWRYFCGCAWSLIRERQAIATSLLEVDGEKDA